MSLSLSIDIRTATLADLQALVAAARTAGVDPAVALDFDAESHVLSVVADEPQAPQAPQAGPDGDRPRHRAQQSAGNSWDLPITNGVGEAAVRSVIDILTGRQEPPRER